MIPDVSEVFFFSMYLTNIHNHFANIKGCSSISVVLNLCYSDAFELQLPETPVRTAGGEGFWELQSKTPE